MPQTPWSSGSGRSRAAQAADGPVGDAEAAALLAPLAARPSLALAVSGGPDSLALLLLVAAWRRSLPAPPAVHVLTVDHRLRPESAAEARRVVEIAEGLGLPASVLVRTGAWAAGGVEARARAARYALLAAAMAERGVADLVLAHHRDDQAETFLMRLACGSGPVGLAAMRPRVERDGLTLWRPLLDVAKDRLVATCEAAGLVPADDPSNHDDRLARGRLRRLQPALAGAGLSNDRLAAAARRMARVADTLDHYAGRLIAEAVQVDALAVLHLRRAAYLAAPDEVRLRVLARLLGCLGEGDYPPRLERLEALDAAMAAGPMRRRTLAGAVVETSGEGFRLYREFGRIGAGTRRIERLFSGVWDGRFRIEVAVGEGAAPVELGALGGEDCAAAGLPAAARPRAALAALPALRRAGALVAVPALGRLPPAGAGIRVLARCITGEKLCGSDGTGSQSGSSPRVGWSPWLNDGPPLS